METRPGDPARGFVLHLLSRLKSDIWTWRWHWLSQDKDCGDLKTVCVEKGVSLAQEQVSPLRDLLSPKEFAKPLLST
jgi:hypothetical protein